MLDNTRIVRGNNFIPKVNWETLGEEFENKNAKQIVEYSLTELIKSGDVVFLTAFGPEGCALLKIIADLVCEGKFPKDRIIDDVNGLNLQHANQIHVARQTDTGRLAIANLDTGYQFKETLELKEQLEQKYGLKILMMQPELTVPEQDTKYGKDLFTRDPDQCCYMRKLVPLAHLLENKLAWITSIRRDQTEHRANAQAFEYDKKFKLGKINPLIKWTKSDVWKFIHENQVPYNVLLDRGYDSIGCEPCTKPGVDRKGRWAGKDKIECGLHIQDEEVGGEFVI